MSLTTQQKQNYVDAINYIWDGAMQCNSVDYISSNVANLMNSIFYQIKDASKSVFLVDLASQTLIIKMVYGPTFKSWEIFMDVAKSDMEGPISKWLNIVKGKQGYSSVINSAALNYRSPVQIALYDAAFGF